MMMLPVIVMPTYNERENMEKMARTLMGLDLGLSLLVIDDNSPDGTGEIVDRLAEEFDSIHVEHRPGKAGLGTAYRHGFEVALGMGADYIIEMDADFSHDPKYLADMLAAAPDHDVVIGSRYVEGGGTVNWGMHDTTSGFRCHKADVIRKIDFSRISATGFGFQVELSYVCTILGFDIFEIPIVFADRAEGESKMSKDIVFEAMRLVAGLRRKYRDVTRSSCS
jgi:dolichol-phosphate mannosyltransferase